MSNKSFKINPCKGCKKNYDIKDINNINQCCYDTLGAYVGGTLNDFRNRPEAANCDQCLTESKLAMGRDLCEFRLTAYPGWIQAPHYFPGFLESEGDVEKAKDMCMQTCETNTYSGECQRNCKIDADAVESVENFLINSKFSDNNILKNDSVFLTVISIGIIFGVCALVFAINFIRKYIKL
jgi:hypothetical protein